VVICLERGADLHTAQLIPLPLTVSCFSKIQIGFTFLVPAHPASPGQRAIKQVCVWVRWSGSIRYGAESYWWHCSAVGGAVCWCQAELDSVRRQVAVESTARIAAEQRISQVNPTVYEPPYGSRCCNVPRFICWLRHYIKCLLPYLSYKVTFFPCLFTFLLVPSVLWCCWSGWCHCHSLSLASVKSRLVLPFWYRLTRVVPEIGPLNGCVCVFTFLLIHFFLPFPGRMS